MNIFLKLNPDELGRFLLAYNRNVFGPLTLGQSFLFYYGLNGYKNIRESVNDNIALELIKSEFLIGE